MSLPVPPAKTGEFVTNRPPSVSRETDPFVAVTVLKRASPAALLNTILPVPVVRLLTLAVAAMVLSISILPLVVSAVILAAERLAVIPVTALSSALLAVTRPAPEMSPAEVAITTLPAALADPLKIMLPLVVVLRVRSLEPPTMTDVATVRSPLMATKSTEPSVVATVPKEAFPVLLNTILPVPVVRLLTVAAMALSISILPLVVSAVMVAAERLAVIPLVALRSAVAAVTRPVPVIAPNVVVKPMV